MKVVVRYLMIFSISLSCYPANTLAFVHGNPTKFDLSTDNLTIFQPEPTKRSSLYESELAWPLVITIDMEGFDTVECVVEGYEKHSYGSFKANANIRNTIAFGIGSRFIREVWGVESKSMTQNGISELIKKFYVCKGWNY